jgi:hypothetical protein
MNYSIKAINQFVSTLVITFDNTNHVKYLFIEGSRKNSK